MAARRRLQEMRGSGKDPEFFTSDLSINEFFVVREAGFDPLGLVMGSSIYHIGYQRAVGWKQNQELTVLTQAFYNARELAMTRMEEEADILGADGIVGVRLTVKNWDCEVAEFISIGTAIRHREGGHFRTAKNRPFTSDLSGQDFWTLLRTGYHPISLVMGICVYHAAHQGFLQTIRQQNFNTEMPTYTQALYDARELALSRMQAEARADGAKGIVGARVEETFYGWEDNGMEYCAVGTSVGPLKANNPIPTPTLVIPLSDSA